MTTGAIQPDAQTVETAVTESEAAEAFLARFMKDSPDNEGQAEEDENEEGVETETTDAEDESEDEAEPDEEEGDEESEEGEGDEDEGDEDDDRKIIEDDAETYVKVKVDGEDRTVSVRDLKRLYGQEASLTRKSQDVSKRRKEAEELGAKYVAGLNGLMARAQERAKPYKNVDWLAAAQQLKPEELNALKTEAEAVFNEEKYLGEELNKFMGEFQKQRQTALEEKGREAVKELKRDIPGWNEKVYNDVRQFAISSGLEVDIVDNLVDAAAIKLIHKAMLYDRGKSNVVTTKKKGKPKKVIKTSKTSGPTTKDVIGGKTTAARAMKKLKDSGSTDDAANAFLSRWQMASDE